MADSSNSERQNGTRSRTLHPRKVLERISLLSGVALLAFWGVAMLHQHAGSALALAQFEDAALGAGGPAPSSQIDFTLWDRKRVRAYLKSIPLLKEQPVGVLSFSRLNLRAPIFAGTSDLALNRGIGWIEGTAKPGDSGNSGIAGHRDGFFRPLKDARVGDLIELSTTTGRLTYEVDQISIVSPEDTSVLHPQDGSALTLVTCYPFYYAGDAPKRYIVHAKRNANLTTTSVRESGSTREGTAQTTHQGVAQ